MTEEEDKKFEENNPGPDVVFVDGYPCIKLKRNAVKPKTIKVPFPFTNLMEERKKYLPKLLEELQKKYPPKGNVGTFDIFVIDIFPIEQKKDEAEDDCDSE